MEREDMSEVKEHHLHQERVKGECECACVSFGVVGRIISEREQLPSERETVENLLQFEGGEDGKWMGMKRGEKKQRKRKYEKSYWHRFIDLIFGFYFISSSTVTHPFVLPLLFPL